MCKILLHIEMGCFPLIGQIEHPRASHDRIDSFFTLWRMYIDLLPIATVVVLQLIALQRKVPLAVLGAEIDIVTTPELQVMEYGAILHDSAEVRLRNPSFLPLHLLNVIVRFSNLKL